MKRENPMEKILRKDEKICPYCNKVKKITTALKGRAKKYGWVEIRCMQCKNTFRVDKDDLGL